MRKKKLVEKGAGILFTAVLMITAAAIPTAAADSAADSNEDEEQRDFGAGVSVLSPGLPAALKGVWMPGDWGIQAEWNYFYALGMLRLDGRRIVRQSGPFDLYGFAGITGNHFNDGKHNADSINNTLMVANFYFLYWF